MVEAALCLNGTAAAMDIGLLASWVATSSADTFRCLFPMVAPVVGDALSRAELPARPVEGSGTPERPPAVITGQGDRAMQMFAFVGAEDVPGVEPVRRFVYYSPTLRARLEETAAGGGNLAIPATVMLVLPRREGSELFTAGGTCLRRLGVRAEGIDANLGLGIGVSAEHMGDQFDDLAVITPYDAGTRIEQQFRHIVDVAALEVGLVEHDAYPERRIAISDEVPRSRLQLPSDPFFRVSRLAGRIGTTAAAEAWALLREGFAGDAGVDPDAGLCYSAGPC